MNITHVTDQALRDKIAKLAGDDTNPDMLVMLFAAQKLLHDKYLEIEERNGIGLALLDGAPANVHDARSQQVLKDYAWRVTEEIGEAMSCLKNKPWKTTQVLTDVDHYEEELIDALHFFIELLLLSGITAERVFELYMRKHEVNQFRQRSAY